MEIWSIMCFWPIFADFRFQNACDFVFSVDEKFDQGLGPRLKM